MWQAIIEVILLFLKWWFEKQTNNAEAMKLFYKFVHEINCNYMNSGMAEEKWKKQGDELAKLLDEMVV
jgi:hypothetical protein